MTRYNFDRDLLIIDTESTGVEDWHVICQWGSLLLDQNTLEEKSSYSTLVRINHGDLGRAEEEAMMVHKIDPRDLLNPQKAPLFPQVAKSILEAHGSPKQYHIYGVNVAFDIVQLRHMCSKYKVDFPFKQSPPESCRIYDIQSMWSILSAVMSLGWGTASLRQMARHFCIPIGEKHDALEDCRVAAEILKQTLLLFNPNSLTPELCPSCNSNMNIRRNSSTGKRFWGCSNYPICKKTRKLD